MLNSGYTYSERLGKKALGHTALSYLITYYDHSSQATWQERFNQGQVLVDHLPAHGHEFLKEGQVLIWNRPGWIEEDTPQQYQIIYQDEHILVVNKPSGLPTMPAGGFLQNTLFSLVRQTFPKATPVHRLGRGTSGLVLFALNSHANAVLSQQWREQSVKKIYLALAVGTAHQDNCEITQAIGLLKHPRLGNIYAACQDGKPSLSVAKVLERKSEMTLFEVMIKTGRPHQIRIHLASIGHPLVGDPLYGIGGLPKSDALPGEGGYFLHAKGLEFVHLNQQMLKAYAPIPKAFQNMLTGQEKRLKCSSSLNLVK
jgi:23S rRNA pseudouridine1911/1915/1917 synthase